jgi:hypothetical protein
MNNHEMIHKGLYFYNLENLINILHSAVISINDYITHFYIQLNKVKVSSHSLKSDGIYIVYGIENSIVISLLQSSFTSIFTVLDILTKIAFEIENLPNSWQDYPRYSSSNILYTSYKKLRNKYSDESIFTNNYYIKLTETMRNEFIHNHNLESIPKFYCEVKNFTVVQKFILFPDIDKYGNLVKSKNRKRFFSQEKKINLELPEFIEVIYRKVHITLKEMNHKIKE